MWLLLMVLLFCNCRFVVVVGIRNSEMLLVLLVLLLVCVEIRNILVVFVCIMIVLCFCRCQFLLVVCVVCVVMCVGVQWLLVFLWVKVVSVWLVMICFRKVFCVGVLVVVIVLLIRMVLFSKGFSSRLWLIFLNIMVMLKLLLLQLLFFLWKSVLIMFIFVSCDYMLWFMLGVDCSRCLCVLKLYCLVMRWCRLLVSMCCFLVCLKFMGVFLQVKDYFGDDVFLDFIGVVED